MRSTSITELYGHLASKLGEETTEKLITFIGGEMKDKFEHNMKTLATKEDLAKFVQATRDDFNKLVMTTRDDFNKLVMTTRDDFNKLVMATREDLSKLALATKEDLMRLDAKINQTKVDLIKWMFGFWITIIIMFIGLYFKS